MTRSFGRVLLAAALVLAAHATSAQAQGFKIIVNASNPMTSVSREQLSHFFLRPSAWEDGSAVVAVDLEETSDVRKNFSRAVLKRDVAAVKAGWMQLMFAGRGVPPTLRHDDASVESLVAGNPKAIGYVAADAQVTGHVKVLKVTDQ